MPTTEALPIAPSGAVTAPEDAGPAGMAVADPPAPCAPPAFLVAFGDPMAALAVLSSREPKTPMADRWSALAYVLAGILAEQSRQAEVLDQVMPAVEAFAGIGDAFANEGLGGIFGMLGALGNQQ